jgi:hypothetical protein
MERELFFKNQPLVRPPDLVIELRQAQKRPQEKPPKEKPPSLLGMLLLALLNVVIESARDAAGDPTKDRNRGRDAHYWAPPAQNRTCGIPAYGSHLG